MIDLATALEIAQVIRAPIEQAFLQQIGRQAADALVKRVSSLRDLIFNAVDSREPGHANLQPISETEGFDPEELAARILLAAKNNEGLSREVLGQFMDIKRELDAGQATGNVSATASERSTIYQIVNPRGNVAIHGSAHDAISSALLPAAICSPAAHELLVNAAASDGRIVKTTSIGRPPNGGLCISTKTRAFISDDDPRLRAKWECALSELVELGFLTPPSGPRGGIYQVTQKGYQYLDDQSQFHGMQEAN
jgi:hypothetical protein